MEVPRFEIQPRNSVTPGDRSPWPSSQRFHHLGGRNVTTSEEGHLAAHMPSGLGVPQRPHEVDEVR